MISPYLKLENINIFLEHSSHHTFFTILNIFMIVNSHLVQHWGECLSTHWKGIEIHFLTHWTLNLRSFFCHLKCGNIDTLDCKATQKTPAQLGVNFTRGIAWPKFFWGGEPKNNSWALSSRWPVWFNGSIFPVFIMMLATYYRLYWIETDFHPSEDIGIVTLASVRKMFTMCIMLSICNFHQNK